MEANSIGMAGGLEVLRTFVSLIVVLGMILAVYYWLKRRSTMPGPAQKRMRVIERLPIDSRRSLLLLQVDGEEIVVSVGNDSLSPVHVVKKEHADEA